MAIDENVAVQKINVSKLQQRLAQDPLLNGSSPDVLADNDDTGHVELMGRWERMTSGGYGESFFQSSGPDNASVTFHPVFQKTGKYHLYTYLPLVNDAADSTVYVINNRQQHIVTIPSPKEVEGQTSGEWVSLGTFNFDKETDSSIKVLAGKGNGTFVADAILFVPE